MEQNKTHKLYAFTLILTFITAWAFSQVPNTINFSKKDGLDCNQINRLLCDKNNFIWIATDNGLFKYDGYKFKKYDTYNGLPANNIVDIVLNDSIITAICENGSFAVFNGKIFNPHPFNKHLLEVSKGNRPVKSTLNFSEEHVSLCFHNIGFVDIDSNRNIYSTKHRSLFENIHEFIKSKENSDSMLVSIQKYLKKNESSILGNPKFKYGDITFCSKNRCRSFCCGNLCICCCNGVVKHSFNDKRILSADFVDNVYYKAAENSGIVFYTPRKKIELLKGISVTHAIADHEKGIWIATKNRGLFYVKNLHVNNYDNFSYSDTTNINSIVLCMEGVVIADNGTGTINKIEEVGGLEKSIVLNQLSRINNMVCLTRQKKLACIVDNMHLAVFNNTWQHNYYSYPIEKMHSLAVFSDTLFISTDIGVFYFNQQLGKISPYVSYKKAEKSNLFTTHNKLYVAFDSVFAEVRGRFLYNCLKNRKIPTDDILGVIQTDVSNFIVANNYGLIKIFEGDLFVENKINGIDISETKIFAQNNNYSFLVTDAGVVVIPKINGLLDHDKAYVINQTIGISSLEIENIVASDINIYVKGKQGLDIVPITEIENIINVQMHKPNLFINEVEIPYCDTIQIDNNKQVPQFYFPLCLYKHERQFKIRYIIQDVQKDYTITNNPLISLFDLPYGTHRVLFSVTNYTGGWSEPIELTVIKKQHFHTRTWFIFLVVFVTLSILVYLIKLHFSYISKLNEIKNDRKQMGNRIVSQQFNPHFLFNSLNAIHHFVLTNNKTESSKYLIKFSTLMRYVTDCTDKEYISLEDEIAALLLYVELEKLRFPEKFIFRVNISEDIDKNRSMVLPFIIQPIVENAIRHGIMPSEKHGEILVDIKLVSEYLMIVVDDNGSGRAKAAKRTISSQIAKKKMGNNILFQRIKHYNSINVQKISINIVDLYDDDGTSKGTKVVLLLPLIEKTLYLGNKKIING